MTPPDTNLKKQRRRHWPVYWGFVGAFALAVLAWIVLIAVEGEAIPEPVTGRSEGGAVSN